MHACVSSCPAPSSPRAWRKYEDALRYRDACVLFGCVHAGCFRGLVSYTASRPCCVGRRAGYTETLGRRGACVVCVATCYPTLAVRLGASCYASMRDGEAQGKSVDQPMGCAACRVWGCVCDEGGGRVILSCVFCGTWVLPFFLVRGRV